MPTLGEVATVTELRRPRKDRSERLMPWAEYEPLYNQLRNNSSSQDETMRLIGYAGGTHVAEWKKLGVPTVAVYATKWRLQELRAAPVVEKKQVRFSFEEAADLFAAVRGLFVAVIPRRALTKKLASILADSE